MQAVGKSPLRCVYLLFLVFALFSIPISFIFYVLRCRSLRVTQAHLPFVLPLYLLGPYVIPLFCIKQRDV